MPLWLCLHNLIELQKVREKNQKKNKNNGNRNRKNGKTIINTSFLHAGWPCQ